MGFPAEVRDALAAAGAELVVLLLLAWMVVGRGYRPALLPLAGGLLFGGLWAYLLEPMPSHWLGLADGYFYEMYIKHYTHARLLTDWVIRDVAGYPPYFFYLVAKLGSLAGIEDVGRMYAWSFVLTYGLSPMVAYLILRHALEERLAALASLLVPLLFTLMYAPTFVQKPHEVAAFTLLASSTVVLVSPAFLSLGPIRRAAMGVAFGLGVGAYTPMAVGFAFAAAFLLGVLWLAGQRAAAMRLLRAGLDPASVLAALIVSAPWLATLLAGMVTHGTSPHVVFFNAGTIYGFGFLASPAFLTAAVPVLVVLGLTISRGRAVGLDRLEARLALLALGGLVLLALLRLGPLVGFFQTSIFKHEHLVTWAGWLAGLLLLARYATLRALATGVVLAMLLVYPYQFMATYRGEAAVAGQSLARSVALSTARDQNPHLQSVVRAIDGAPDLASGPYYLANDEYRFLNYYTRKELFPRLYYNHSYASGFEPRAAMLAELGEAIGGSDHAAFTAFLERYGIGLIALSAPIGSPWFTLQLLTNTDRFVPPLLDNQEQVVIDIPTLWIDGLLLDGRWKLLYRASDEAGHHLVVYLPDRS